MRVFLALVLAVMAAGAATAGTVTLTGTCSQSVTNTINYITFNISNSGNDTATNLSISPHLTGFSTYDTGTYFPILGSGTSHIFKFQLYNYTSTATYPGRYAESFVASYSQGAYRFSAVFPCEINLFNSSQSAVSITNVTQLSDGNFSISLFNRANATLNVTLAALLPSGFTATPSPNTFLIGGGQRIVRMKINTPPLQQAAVTIGIALSYTRNNTHYSDLAAKTLYINSALAQPSPIQSATTPLIFFIGAIVAIIVALIALSIYRKRTKKVNK